LFINIVAESDVRSLLASLEFVLSSASRFSTTEDHLRAELQQVGLPKEHASALARIHNDATVLIRQRLIQNSLKSEDNFLFLKYHLVLTFVLLFLPYLAFSSFFLTALIRLKLIVIS
jgi:hypothetical protein